MRKTRVSSPGPRSSPTASGWRLMKFCATSSSAMHPSLIVRPGTCWCDASKPWTSRWPHPICGRLSGSVGVADGSSGLLVRTRRGKREPGGSPGLPRSGEWERPPSSRTGRVPGKRRPVGLPAARGAEHHGPPARPRVRRPAVGARTAGARPACGRSGRPDGVLHRLFHRPFCSTVSP
jgi:hypothetical protein